MSRIVVLGDGAWGTALSAVAQASSHDMAMWSRRRPDHQHVAHAEAIIAAVPAQVLCDVLAALPVPKSAPLILAAKGIELSTHRFMHEVAKDVCPHNPVLILSGPSFAEDVTRGLPTAVTLAAATMPEAVHWAAELSRPHFRIYASDDLMGVAIGGSLKNVLAIACGIADGKGLGASARAALTARGFAELSRLGKALGARSETLMGLSGLGDLVLTCSSTQSRNYSFGRKLGEGLSVAEAMAQSKGVVEGVHSAEAALALARAHAIALPVAEAVAAVVGGRMDTSEAIRTLLSRPLAVE